MRKTPALLLLAIVGLAGTVIPPASATDSLGTLDLRLRLLDVERGGGRGPDQRGAARLEVVLWAAQETQSILLSVERADGSSWTVGGRAFDPEPILWRRADGSTPPAGTSGRPAAAARGVLRATVTVPLQGASVHEIVVRATGVTREGPATTEAMVRAPLGVTPPGPVHRDGYAIFEIPAVKP